MVYLLFGIMCYEGLGLFVLLYFEELVVSLVMVGLDDLSVVAC